MTEAAVYTILVQAWLVVAGIVFVALLFVDAPYGRHLRSGWGPTVNATVGWVVMESPAVAVLAVLFLIGEHETRVTIGFFVLWQVHYLHRALIYPFRRPPSDRRTPWAIVLMAVAFNLVNGYLNGRWLFSLGPGYDASWLSRPTLWVGVALFVAGFAVNFHADTVLLRLRREGGDEYHLPRGGLFRYVSCPNYLGEIVEWTGWAIATWSLAGASFALWTAANLVPRALSHHRWYRERFADYPRERKALIPLLL